MTGRLIPLAVAAVAAGLTGCSDSADTPGETRATQASNGTIASTVAGNGELRRLSDSLSDTQLATVLDGQGSYTLLAPTDAAFTALGDKAAALETAERRPLLVAVLRGHILPGQVTPRAIGDAIDSKGGPVEMRTMAGTVLTFSQGETGIEVSNGTARARLTGTAHTAANGAVLPVDAVLMPAAQ